MSPEHTSDCAVLHNEPADAGLVEALQQIAFYARQAADVHGCVCCNETAGTALAALAQSRPDLMGERHRDLGVLMEACGVHNDGLSSPAVLHARCIEKIKALRSAVGDAVRALPAAGCPDFAEYLATAAQPRGER